VIGTVSLACHSQAVLHFLHEFLPIALLKEMKAVGEMDDPGMRVVTGEA
jgi:hypothetical protein